MRIEEDSIGKVEIASDKFWGAQTERAIGNFAISHHRLPRGFIKALGSVKKAAALSNHELGKLSQEKLDLIIKAADEVICGELDAHFPLSVWQSGSGTQTNMNANEVIANRAIALARGEMGSKSPVHPNDDVNMSQSTNDSFPTAIHVAVVAAISQHLIPEVEALQAEFFRKAESFGKIIKVGRTHLMDATPLTLEQEVHTYGEQLTLSINNFRRAKEDLLRVPIGGSSVGTGLNTHPDFAATTCEHLSAITEESFQPLQSKFVAMAAHDVLVHTHGCLKTLAVSLFKIANDIRLLASGPRCGIGELSLPANEPGSSIMPGKVNPTQCEAMTMLTAKVMGNDACMAIAGSGGQLQLNTYKPLIAHTLLESIELLADGCRSIRKNMVEGLQAVEKTIAKNLENTLMLVTALNQTIGYDNAAKIAKKAHAEGTTLKEAATTLGLVTSQEFDELVDPRKMVKPVSG